MDDKWIWLEYSIHRNICNFDLDDSILDNLKISFDGTIVAVTKEFVGDYENDLNMIKTGYKKPDIPRSVKSIDDLKRVLIYCL